MLLESILNLLKPLIAWNSFFICQVAGSSTTILLSLEQATLLYVLALPLLGSFQSDAMASDSPVDLHSNQVALLSELGELIAREEAFQEAVSDMTLSSRQLSNVELNVSTLNDILGDDLLARYDVVLPILESVGVESHRDAVAARFDATTQEALAAGDRVDGVNDGAINLVVAHYKIAIEQLDIDLRTLMLAEAQLLRRAGEELAAAIDDSGQVRDYAHYVRASRLLSAPRRIKGYTQSRCSAEGDARKKTRDLRNEVDDQFFLDDGGRLQVSAQSAYDAASAIEAEAESLLADGSHCK